MILLPSLSIFSSILLIVLAIDGPRPDLRSIVKSGAVVIKNDENQGVQVRPNFGASVSQNPSVDAVTPRLTLRDQVSRALVFQRQKQQQLLPPPSKVSSLTQPRFVGPQQQFAQPPSALSPNKFKHQPVPHSAFLQDNVASRSSLDGFINNANVPFPQSGQLSLSQASPFPSNALTNGLLNAGSSFFNPQTLSQQGLPNSGGLPQQSSSSSGLLGVLNNLGKQLSGAVGLDKLLPKAASTGSSQIPTIPLGGVQAGPPVPGFPNLSGLPGLPGALGPNGQIDFLNLFSAISRRAFNGSSLSELIPPNQAQKFADNITDTLLPSTAALDLSKFMGRWFEGINSPRATDQRCVVHHYGGLTENGKTVTFTSLKIYREGSEFGQVRYSIGYAFRGGRQGGMLQMHSSEASDPVPYWIYRVGPVGKDPFGNEQYEYAVVSNWIRYPIVVLVRDPDKFRQKYEEDVMRWLEDNQFVNGFTRTFNLVQPADYANCQYADSTFEIFGKK